MKMSKFFAISSLVLMLSVTSCVSKKKYQALQSDYDSLQKEYASTQALLGESKANGQTIDALLKEARAANEDLRRRYDALQGNLAQSLQQNAQGNMNISKLVDEIIASN